MSIEKLRQKIDGIDKKIVALLNDRADISKDIGKLKIKNNKGIYSPAREKQVLTNILEASKGSLSREALEAIYREIMSSSIALEKDVQIACLGTKGAFTYTAATNKFGSQTKYVSCSNIPEVFQKVEQGDCDYGVVPIENSVEGAVTDTFDFLVDSEPKVCAQILLPISHNLLSHEPLKGIKNIYSNPQVFGQCRNWLAQHLPTAGQIFVAPTTEAAAKAAKQKYAAAIASNVAAQVYEIPILKANIQDIAHNTTRFLVIATQDAPPTGKDRTSILFSIKDKVGALYVMLKPFFENNINLTKIESRPSKRKAWDYYFFIDIEGHRQDRKVKKALDQLEGMCKFLKVVGSYPVAE